MKVGLIVLSVGSFGKNGFYNLQEVGLAKSLARHCEKVVVYKMVSSKSTRKKERINGTTNAEINYIPVKTVGTNGIPNVNYFDNDFDAVICFSDTQLAFPKIYNWAQKNDILLIPYIGVVESHGTNKIKSIIINALFLRNIKKYKKCICFAKTPDIKAYLTRHGVQQVKECPVGIDLSLTKEDYFNYEINNLKNKYNYASQDKVILFIGRMCNEKQPMRMLKIYSYINKEDSKYKLLMVGKGELLEDVREAVSKDANLKYNVQIIDQIPNKDIWELYRIADCMVNLNQKEIFGMVLLEALYYGCKVIAWEAPGPQYIIQNGVSGFICRSNREIVEKVLNSDISEEAMIDRVKEHFTWDKTVQMMEKILNKESE